MRLNVATCQFPVSDAVESNLDHVLRLMRDAGAAGADVAHFPEACLPGYPPNDRDSYDGFDWEVLKRATERVMAEAAALELWTVLGSAHRLSGDNKPHNCLYFIDDRGRIVDRYDKRFLSGDRSGQTGDLRHFSPGDHFSAVSIKGVRCGALICVDCRYPELYRAYKRLGVDLVFHSFNAAHLDEEEWSAIEAAIGTENHPFNPATTYPGITQPAMMHAAAGSNHLWISCANSCAWHSCWPSFFVRSDGVATGRLAPHQPGLLLSTVDTEERHYDSTIAWRDRAMSGVLHSGELVRDPRSGDRTRI